MPEIWRGKPRTQVILLFFGIRVKIIFSNMCIDVYTNPIVRCLQQFTKFDADISKTEARSSRCFKLFTQIESTSSHVDVFSDFASKERIWREAFFVLRF